MASRLPEIHSSVFTHGCAMSFRDHPRLAHLFETFKRADEPVTLVIGAGASIDAGLPSWSELVSTMADSIKDPDLAQLARDSAEPDDRRAETIIQIARQIAPSLQPDQIIRDALYRDQEPQSGLLIAAIVRLVAAFKSNVRIITTNYDILLEEALEREVAGYVANSYTLKNVDRWEEECAIEMHVPILHVHGILRPGKNSQKPLVLTATDFLTYGRDVQKTLEKYLGEGPALFIGLGMSDPNLIGPLFRIADSRTAKNERRLELRSPGMDIAKRQSFGLFVPDISLASPDYHAASARFIERALHVHPVLLKSYSQLTQVVSDLALAKAAPDAYTRSASKRSQSLHYGYRFDGLLKQCYETLGFDHSGRISSDDSYALSQAALKEMKRHPLQLLRRVSRDYGVDISDERFGMHLWLRTRSSGRSPYALKLVASSVYSPLENWSRDAIRPIGPDPDYLACTMVYEGQAKLVNLDPSRNGGRWKGMVGAPIIYERFRSDVQLGREFADQLMVGAVTLDTSKQVIPEDQNEEVSIIGLLAPRDRESLIHALVSACAALLSVS